MTSEPTVLVAFAGTDLIARGPLADVVVQCKELLESGEDARIALFDDESGRPVDIDFIGSQADVLARLAAHPMVGRPPRRQSEPRRGPGRPRLGVVSREVSLLPRHWSWLAEQRGGASATLRRLVDAARKETGGREEVRKAIEAAHRFMWDMAGNQPGFEEASRALFAQDFETFTARISAWPCGIGEQLERFVIRARQAGEPAGPTRK